MRQVIRLGTRASQSSIPILIEGESGVGKELVARAIQGGSERAGRPFVTVNCGAIPENLIESILFGHEKGAFTGATDKHLGKFQEADGGTLFLDEIGELRLDMQVKLLRALQEGEIDPVGAKRPVKVDVRIISATNRDLNELTKEGKFREDLYYRLNVFPVFVPPLRERQDDIPALARVFRHALCRRGKQAGRGLHARSARAAELLCLARQCAPAREHGLPRRRAVRRGDARHRRLSADRRRDGRHAARAQAAHRRLRRHVRAMPVRPAAARYGRPYGVSAADQTGHMRKLEDVESEIIKMAIERYSGRMSEVARRLGIGRSTLYRKLKEYGLEAGEVEANDDGDDAQEAAGG